MFSFLSSLQIFFRVVVLVYIPTNSVRGFLFPRILANTCCEELFLGVEKVSNISSLKYKVLARHWWLIPVILTAKEAEIRRILV
jgi:hypothetical protein